MVISAWWIWTALSFTYTEYLRIFHVLLESPNCVFLVHKTVHLFVACLSRYIPIPSPWCSPWIQLIGWVCWVLDLYGYIMVYPNWLVKFWFAWGTHKNEHVFPYSIPQVVNQGCNRLIPKDSIKIHCNGRYVNIMH